MNKTDQLTEIEIKPVNKVFNFKEKLTILDALRRIDIPILSSCGGNRICGECRVKITNQVPEIDDIDGVFFSETELKKGWRLACAHKIKNSMIIEVPDVSRKSEILVSDFEKIEKLDTNIDKYFIKQENFKNVKSKSYSEAIGKIIEKQKESTFSKNSLKEISPNLDEDFTVTFNKNEIIHIEKGNKIKEKYGLAIDIGTTTLAALLVDLNKGKTLAVEWGINSQSKYGADVMSRIKYTVENRKGTNILQNIIIDDLNYLIQKLKNKTKIKYENIYKVVLCGNTVMEHLLINVPPKPLGHFPFKAVFTNTVTSKASDIRLKANPEAEVLLLPSIGSFVGGDITSLIYITGLYNDDKLSLALDLGTNGEIVLGNKEKILCGSAAMGPAFEGAQIKCGMSAVEGAVNRFKIDDKSLKLQTIGNKEPAGICGSGLIDIIAEMLRNNILDDTGRFVDKKNHKFGEKFILVNNQPAFVVYKDNKRKIYITQKDVREFQLAKGAIRAGIEILIKKLGIEKEDIEKVYVAGAFGNYLDKENLKKINIFPDIPLEKIHFVGNTASMGAKAALLSGKCISKMNKIARKTKHISFANEPEFQNIFTESMLFK